MLDTYNARSYSNTQVFWIATPPQVARIYQPHVSYQSQPIMPSNIVISNPQEIFQSYVPPNYSQPKVYINVLPQSLPSSSQLVLPTYS